MAQHQWAHKEWSLSKVKKHIKGFDVKFGPEMAQRVNGSDLCALYLKFGPILKLIANALFFSKALKKGYLMLIAALDINCDIVDPE